MTQQSHASLAIHPATDQASEDPHDLPRRREVVRRTRWVVIVVLVLLAAGAARTIASRMLSGRELEKGTAERAVQYVRTVHPTVAGAGQTLVLPGTLQGFVQAPIAARASGYLKRWTRDIGSRVKQGELLAEIETPEIDQQLSQAEAARQQAQAGQALASSTVARWEALRQRDVVSQQDLDERRSSNAQASANVAAAEANVQRLRQQQGFKRVVAPFDGVVTRRNVDVGDLIDAGSAGGRSLFTMAQTDPLRIYINVPQSAAGLVKVGQPAIVTQAEMRGQKFEGKIVRTSGAIDAATRTLQTEIALSNADGALMPGAYVQVSLPLLPSKSLTVPSNTLMFRSGGPQVASVDAGGKVHLQKVSLGRNYGESVEVLQGVEARDRLVMNPSDALAEGDSVTVAAAPAPAVAAPAKVQP